MKRWWWLFPALAVVGVLAGVIVASVITYVQPKEFDSTAVVELKAPGSVNISFDSGSPSSGEGESEFLRQEMDLLKSPGLLRGAVKQIDFDKRWGVSEKTAVETWQRSISVERLPGTDLVTIRARYVNREDARDMVTAVITEYRKHRSSVETGASEEALKALSAAVQEQEAQVTQRRKALEELAEKRRLLHESNGLDPQSDASYKEQYAAAKQEFETELALLQTLKLKLVTEKASREMNHEVLVTHEEPRVALTPSSPNVSRNMRIGLLSGLLVSQVVALLLAILLPSQRHAEGGGH